MICRNCPFSYKLEPIDNNDDSYHCDIDGQVHDNNDECYFPETIMEKGV